MKKYIIAGVLVVAFIAYLVFASRNPSSVATLNGPSTTLPASTPSTTGPTTEPTTTPSGNPPGKMPPPFMGTLSLGATGPLVSWLQQFLIASKYLTAVPAPTGYFGTFTKAALAEFQTANGISPATGSLDATTTALIKTMIMATSTTSSGQYKDGTYTGSVADAFYGNLQVVATIQGGAITDITFPQYPTGGNSSNVSGWALPTLKQEAITAQSADVHIVSGATQDSQAFQQSLAVALAQAKK
ncbi:MAG TPA: peptidoglycan-binding protein [Candidatus Paceibacterota bacterium]|nr:peptidoglycan-binding protein [Candidatus Paceibacterota bacterium]